MREKIDLSRFFGSKNCKNGAENGTKIGKNGSKKCKNGFKESRF